MKRVFWIIVGISLPVLAQEVVFEDGFEINHDPVIVSTPVTTASVGSPYSYDVDAEDIDGNALLYLLTAAPQGMTIDPASGLIEWTPMSSGAFDVSVDVSDGKGGSAQQAWFITVSQGQDSDSDGLGDITEEAIGTDPNDPDTDGDGLTDGAEVNLHGSNPLDPDTDRDGLGDGNEVDVHSTDPTQVDTDGDYFGDGVELGAGTDPLNPSDFPAGPPDPQSVATANDPTVTTILLDSVAFLYNGTPPIQTGVEEGTIDPLRVAVLRGHVRTRAGDSLPGVIVSIKDHTQFGQTESRVDGRFDLAVNGGGPLTVSFNHPGFLPVQRTITVPWRDYAELPDVVMIPLDSQATVIDLTLGSAQPAQSSPVTDGDGSRQAALIIPAGTAAELQLEGGGTQPINALTLRATEYTVGPNGPEAMPGLLPPSSGYTYAVELSADETFAEGVTGLTFSQPVFSYTENFLGFPVGTAVPAGFYDRAGARWVPSANGLVIKILGESGGLAEVDIDGDDVADSGSALSDLGFTDAERQNLATTYAAGQELWRVPVEHFTPWDYNWPYGPPADAVPPLQTPPWRENDVNEYGTATCGGSLIDVQDQVVRESVPIAGTPFLLYYSSADVPDRRTGYALNIPLSGPTIPASLKGIELDVAIAGRSYRQTFGAAPDQLTQFAWDGTDAYGRRVFGRQRVSTTVSYVYDAVYYEPDELEQSFGRFGNQLVAADFARQEVRLSQPYSTSVGNFDARSFGLGGWRLDIHHAYDPVAGMLVTGTGHSRGAPTLSIGTVETVAGDPSTEEGGFSGDGGPAVPALLDDPRDMVVLADGSILIADGSNHRIRKVSPDGIISTIAGTGTSDSTGDGGPASSADIDRPSSIAVGPDGNIYFAERSRIRRIAPDGIIHTFAGGGSGGDGGPAIDANIFLPEGIVVANDGTMYFADTWNVSIRRIGTDGIIDTIAGGGVAGYSGDGGPAKDATFQNPNDIAIAPDGSLVIASEQRVRRIATDGTITTIAGNGVDGYSGDGGLATNASFMFARTVAFSGDALYIGDDNAKVVRKVNAQGIISTYAGEFPKSNPSANSYGDGGPPLQAGFYSVWNVAVDSDGALYIADRGASDIRRVAPVYPGYSAGDIGIASEDGSEYYQFNASGKHLRTRHALTGAVLYEFGYDTQGRLQTIADGEGKITTIERNLAGKPTAIVSPFGQVTTLAVDINGFLELIENPAGERLQIDSTPGGLIAETIDPRGRTSSYQYDAVGRLTGQSDNAGYSQGFVRTGSANNFTVTRTTGLGRTTDYRVQRFQEQVQENINTAPDGTQSRATFAVSAGTETTTDATGQISSKSLGADPRFGMQSPIEEKLTVTYPIAGSLSLEHSREVQLSNPSDPLSLVSLTDQFSLNAQTETMDYDAASRTATVVSPEGRTSTLAIDSRGKITQAQWGDLVAFELSYDGLGRLSSVSQGSGEAQRTFTFTYEPNGYLDTVTDPMLRVTSFDYDPVGRVTMHTLAGGATVEYGYDSNGNRISVTPPEKPAHLFDYREDNQLLEVAPPPLAGTASTQYVYNSDGQLVEIVRGDGESVAMEWSTDLRLLSRTLSDGVIDLRIDYLTYDDLGRIEQMSSSMGADLTFNYDGDQVIAEAYAGDVSGTVQRQLNDRLELGQRRVNGETIAFSYDNDGFLTAAGAMSLTRKALTGFVSGSTLGGVSESRHRNEYAELISKEYQYDGAPLYSISLTRDQLGRVTEKVETIGGTSRTLKYMYSAVGRLMEVREDEETLESYDYDANGNRTSTSIGGVSRTAVYDIQDRIVEDGVVSFVHDGAGDLESRDEGGQITGFDYDALGNLNQVSLPDGRLIDYLVDPLGRRIGKRIDGVLVQGFLYDGQQGPLPVAELDAMGNTVSRFVYATGYGPAYMVRSGITYRLVTDDIGSVRLVVDVATGTIAQRLDYDSFGRVMQDTNPGFQPFGFAGGLYDFDTALVRFGRRDYDAQTGRWLTPDPAGYGGGTNRYLYAGGDPVNQVDWSGEASEESLIAQVAAETAEELSKMVDDWDEITKPFRARDPETGKYWESTSDWAKRRKKQLEKIEIAPTMKRLAREAADAAKNACKAAKSTARGLPGILNVYSWWDVIKRSFQGPRDGQADLQFLWDLAEAYTGYQAPPEARGCDSSRQSCVPMLY